MILHLVWRLHLGTVRVARQAGRTQQQLLTPWWVFLAWENCSRLSEGSISRRGSRKNISELSRRYHPATACDILLVGKITQGQKIARRFGIVVAGELIVIGAAIVLLKLFNHPEYIAPMIYLIVGLHFLPLAPFSGQDIRPGRRSALPVGRRSTVGLALWSDA